MPAQLPEGFQPRKCPFCEGRVILNAEFEPGIFKTVCQFCGAQGPQGATNDEAWLAWNGQRFRAPAATVTEGIL